MKVVFHAPWVVLLGVFRGKKTDHKACGLNKAVLSKNLILISRFKY